MSDYNISKDLPSLKVTHNNKTVVIQREQNPDATLSAEYAITARKCPPYCIQPITLAEGIETLGELEVLYYLGLIQQGDTSSLVIDSRTQDWYIKGTIPGAINIPFAQNNAGEPTDLAGVKNTFTRYFGATINADNFIFDDAKTLVIFCNGPWCGQTPNYIRTLLKLGYPADKLKWYRGGMQDWCSLGLTIT